MTELALLFIATCFLTLYLFFRVVKNSNAPKPERRATFIILGILIWMSIQSILAWKAVYSDHKDALPPMIARFGIFPALLLIFSLFLTKKGRRFMDDLPLKEITFLNIVRIPVELVLYVLAGVGYIAQEMSFEGWNFDILAGITAPFIAYFVFVKGKINRKWLLGWNIISLLLLLFIVVISTLSAPSSFQMIFYEPMRAFALFDFPFVWLPTCIVPIVLFGHLVSIRQLLKKQ